MAAFPSPPGAAAMQIAGGRLAHGDGYTARVIRFWARHTLAHNEPHRHGDALPGAGFALDVGQ